MKLGATRTRQLAAVEAILRAVSAEGARLVLEVTPEGYFHGVLEDGEGGTRFAEVHAPTLGAALLELARVWREPLGSDEPRCPKCGFRGRVMHHPRCPSLAPPPRGGAPV